MNTANLENFSLLYSDPGVHEKDKAEVCFAKNPDLLPSLGLQNVFGADRRDILRYVTCDVETINYRADIFADILKNKELYEIMKNAHEYLTDIYDVRVRARNVHKEGVLEDSFFVVNEIELYIKCVNYLAESSRQLKTPVKSKGFRDLFSCMTEIYESEEYRNLVKNIEFLDFRIKNIKSVTIGANVDHQLRITEAGVVSVNDQPFKSGSLMDMLLRMDMKKTEYTTIAPLTITNNRAVWWKNSFDTAFSHARNSFKQSDSTTPSPAPPPPPTDKASSMKDKETEMFDHVFLKTLNGLYSSSIKKWRPIVNSFMRNNTNVLMKLAPEIKFILRCADVMFDLQKTGAGLCKPELFGREKKAFEIKGLYNASLALSLDDAKKIVLNDMVFDENGMIYILTGPNRGGKSVITCAVGIAQLFCQLGMLIPAESAKISPADCIYTHFAGNYNTLDKGRLGEECERLNAILDELTEYSLVLLDETLSSTGAFEGSYIAADVVSGLSLFGCRCIYSTHMHELAALVDEINASAKNKIDTLVAGIEGGARSFKIKREKPDGKSYAKDIAQKYGISFEKMRARAENAKY